MTENITLELHPDIANNILTYADELSKMFGIHGYGPDAALYHLKMKIEEGKIVLEQKQAEEAAKANKPAFKTVICPIDKDSNNHDCWILHKPSKTVYYAPHGHHYALIAYLHAHYPGIIDESWSKSDTADSAIRTGDVKSGNPRTCSENPVTSKKLRPVLIAAYNEARGKVGPF